MGLRSRVLRYGSSSQYRSHVRYVLFALVFPVLILLTN